MQKKWPSPPIKVDDDQHMPSPVTFSMPTLFRLSLFSNQTQPALSHRSNLVNRLSMRLQVLFFPLRRSRTLPRPCKLAQYANIVAPLICSAPLEAGSFVVHQQDNTNRADDCRLRNVLWGADAYIHPKLYRAEPQPISSPTDHLFRSGRSQQQTAPTAVRTNPPPKNSPFMPFASRLRIRPLGLRFTAPTLTRLCHRAALFFSLTEQHPSIHFKLLSWDVSACHFVLLVLSISEIYIGTPRKHKTLLI